MTGQSAQLAGQITDNADDIALLEKENKAFELRYKMAYTFARIANELGYTDASGARKAVQRALKRVEKPEAEEYFYEHIDRLDTLVESYWDSAVNGNPRGADLVLRIMNQQAGLLGLDAPKKIQQEVVTYDGRSHNAEVIRLARIIEFVEQLGTNEPQAITNINNASVPNDLEQDSAEGTATS